MQTGVAGQGEGEGCLTAASVIPLATVVGWDQRRAEWAWRGLPCASMWGRWGGGVEGGGGDVIDVEGEDVDAPRGPKRKAPPPPPTAAPPPKATRTGTPTEHAARERAGGDVAQWLRQQQHSDPW